MTTFIDKHELIEALKEHNYDTFQHSQRVANLTYEFGRYIGCRGENLRLLHEAAEFHDIGKLCISADILKSKERLTEPAFKEMSKHTIFSEMILNNLGVPDKMLQIVRGHHENYNGSGYPDKLSHESIVEGASIIRIIDSYDSMTNDRPYRKAMKYEEAIEELSSLKRVLYNPTLTNKFIEYMSLQLSDDTLS